MKLISLSTLFIIVLSNPSFADHLINKSELLRQYNECYGDFQLRECKNLILEMEKIQLLESEKDRYKCQTSILGLQTELIEAYHFGNLKKIKNGIMLPYVIKNC